MCFRIMTITFGQKKQVGWSCVNWFTYTCLCSRAVPIIVLGRRSRLTRVVCLVYHQMCVFQDDAHRIGQKKQVVWSWVHFFKPIDVCVPGPCPSYWAEEAGEGVPLHYGQHSGGAHCWACWDEAAAGQRCHPARYLFLVDPCGKPFELVCGLHLTCFNQFKVYGVRLGM